MNNTGVNKRKMCTVSKLFLSKTRIHMSGPTYRKQVFNTQHKTPQRNTAHQNNIACIKHIVQYVVETIYFLITNIFLCNNDLGFPEDKEHLHQPLTKCMRQFCSSANINYQEQQTCQLCWQSITVETLLLSGSWEQLNNVHCQAINEV